MLPRLAGYVFEFEVFFKRMRREGFLKREIVEVVFIFADGNALFIYGDVGGDRLSPAAAIEISDPISLRV